LVLFFFGAGFSCVYGQADLGCRRGSKIQTEWDVATGIVKLFNATKGYDVFNPIMAKTCLFHIWRGKSGLSSLNEGAK